MTSIISFCACVIFVIASIPTEAIDNIASLKALTDTLAIDLEKESSADSSDASREINKYLDHLSKVETKFAKKQHAKEISEEEKQEVKFYEDMLKKLRSLNGMEIHNIIEKYGN